MRGAVFDRCYFDECYFDEAMHGFVLKLYSRIVSHLKLSPSGLSHLKLYSAVVAHLNLFPSVVAHLNLFPSLGPHLKLYPSVGPHLNLYAIVQGGQIMEKFEQGQTVHLVLQVRSLADVAYSPGTSTKITITDSAGTVKADAQAMTEGSTGEFYYDHTLAADAALGRWVVEYIADDSAKITPKDHEFEVIA